jgi:thiamine biosynthesis lipoprotein
MRAVRPDGPDLVDAAKELDAHRFAHEAMATVFEVVCSHEDGGYAGQAAQAAFELVDELEGELSRFIANSDISRINALVAGQSTRVSPSTMECLEIARRMYSLTQGIFDVSLGSGLERLVLQPDDFTVRPVDGGIRLDLGGIGKGYAVDRMADLLDEWEIPRALLHGGFSSVRAREAPPGRHGWPLTLSAPGAGDNRPRIRISARQMALSASGTRKGAHIRDPRSGSPVEGGAAWAALPCPSEEGNRAAGEWIDAVRFPAALAEALSTAFMILPLEKIQELCERGPGVEAWIYRRTPGAGPEAALVHLPHSGPAERAVELTVPSGSRSSPWGRNEQRQGQSCP